MMECSLHSVRAAGTSRWDQLEASMELTLAVTTGASKSSTGGQKGRGAARKGGKPGHTRSPQTTTGEIMSFPARESLRPAAPAAPSNTSHSRPR